jgi:hypothetical protein
VKKYPHQSCLNERSPASELQYKLSPTARRKKINLQSVTRRTLILGLFKLISYIIRDAGIFKLWKFEHNTHTLWHFQHKIPLKNAQTYVSTSSSSTKGHNLINVYSVTYPYWSRTLLVTISGWVHLIWIYDWNYVTLSVTLHINKKMLTRWVVQCLLWKTANKTLLLHNTKLQASKYNHHYI